MGNGARAQQKRERNAKANSGKEAKSQLKANEAAKSVICQICRQTFLMTVREPALKQHADNKHGKDIKDCFPTWSPA
ncbi:hypothetical protein Malapachy_1371 [Malassezia pachydermatis]|uniref:DUF1909-domain-containing protein n=1 Tax=Malassezia pachydermatis TaxID=77020 RepID=A0A0M9VMX9_9BASI|nr:hypothetical protein Malapachy_1371 [Malassezia pachydermatis]KOS12763.1 hypothetical protein Malapachy_1371 [Malassezia pachydermatis]